MSGNFKNEVRKRARISMGMVDLLRDDINQLRADARDFDVVCLEESIKDTKETLRMLVDNVTEIEYMLYLANSRE